MKYIPKRTGEMLRLCAFPHPRPQKHYVPVSEMKTRNQCRSCYQRKRVKWLHSERGQVSIKAGQVRWKLKESTQEKRREYELRYKAKHPEEYARQKRESAKRFGKTVKGAKYRKDYQASYQKTENYKISKQKYRDSAKGKEYAVKYWNSHPEVMARNSAKRSARMIATDDGTLTTESIGSLFRGAKTCRYCGLVIDTKKSNPNRKSLDHVIPLVRGGTHALSNVTICCWSCNVRKGDKLIEELESNWFVRRVPCPLSLTD